MNHKLPKLATRVGLVMCLLLAAVFAPLVSEAKPPYATEASIDSISFTQEEVASGNRAQLVGTWSLPDERTAPAGLVVDLPEGLEASDMGFPMKTQGENPQVIGDCKVESESRQLWCDINLESDYFKQNPYNVHGNFEFWVKVSSEVSEQTAMTYQFGNAKATVKVNPPGSGKCEGDCTFKGWGHHKVSYIPADSDVILWKVKPLVGRDGYAGGEEIVVQDMPGEGLEITDVDVIAADRLKVYENGDEAPANWNSVDKSEYSVSDDLTTVTIPRAKAGHYYEVHYVTKLTDPAPTREYTNEALIRIGTEEPVKVERKQLVQGGSADGIGQDQARFSITKKVEGDAEDCDLTFTGTWKVIPPAAKGAESEPVEGTWSVKAGETWISPQLFPKGSTVVLTEDAPEAVDGLTWAEPEFSQNNFELPGGALTNIKVINRATKPEPTPEPTPEPSDTPEPEPTPEPTPSDTPEPEPTPEPTPSDTPEPAPSQTPLPTPTRPSVAPGLPHTGC